MSDEKKFPQGMIVKRNENAPDFVLNNLSIKVDEFTKWMQENADKGWVNLKVKMSKGGKPYAELDTWKPKEQSAKNAHVDAKNDLPF